VSFPSATLAVLAWLAVFLAAAKAHGRQLRLERELEGHDAVDFRRENHPWVEALWRQDRRRFWPTAAVAGVVFGLYTWLAPGVGAPRPDFGGRQPLVLALLVNTVVVGMSVAFTSNGVASALRFRAALKRPVGEETRRDVVERERARWLNDALRGTWIWWAVVAVGAGLVLAAAFGGLDAADSWSGPP